jgi:nucleoside-diphosphate-sugar epimerase
MAKSALISGGTGFIGQHLVEQLLAADWTLHMFCRDLKKAEVFSKAGVQCIKADITDADSLSAALGHDYDVVFHVAANTSTWRLDREQQNRTNIDGTRNMLALFKRAGAGRFVHTSSVAVYGLNGGMISERSRHNPNVRKINYSHSKVVAEDLVRAAVADGADAVILNPCHVMGPLDEQNWIRLFQMVAANKLPGIPPGAGSFADVREVARAHIIASEKGVSGKNYMLGGENHTFRNLIEAVAQRLDVSVKAPTVPALVLKAAARTKDWWSRLSGTRPDMTPEEAAFVCDPQSCDSSRAISELDYRITPLEEILDDTIAWTRAGTALTLFTTIRVEEFLALAWAHLIQGLLQRVALLRRCIAHTTHQILTGTLTEIGRHFSHRPALSLGDFSQFALLTRPAPIALGLHPPQEGATLIRRHTLELLTQLLLAVLWQRLEALMRLAQRSLLLCRQSPEALVALANRISLFGRQLIPTSQTLLGISPLRW